MNKRILAVLLTLAVLLILCGCGVTEGTVCAKDFIPAHNVYMPYTMIINKTVHVIPRWVHYDDRFRICLEDGEGRREWWTVPESTYNSVSVGDYMKMGE